MLLRRRVVQRAFLLVLRVVLLVSPPQTLHPILRNRQLQRHHLVPPSNPKIIQFIYKAYKLYDII